MSRGLVRTLVLALLLSMTAIGCASLHKQGAESLEAGQYDRAAVIYERILSRKPDDPEAKEGLKRARNGIISQNLIEVRKARMAGNQSQALDLLLSVIQKERQWKHFPGAQVAFTQNEESELAFSFARQKIADELKDGHPIAAHYLHFKYAPVFENEKTKSKHASLGRVIAKSGQKSCKNLEGLQKPSLPYFSDFVSGYCQVFSGEGRQPSSGTYSAQKWDELYGRAQLKLEVKDLPPSLEAVVESELASALENTAWFDPKGKKTLNLTIRGDWDGTHEKVLVNQVHQYEVKEPYEVLETVEKTRMVPYQEKIQVSDPKTGSIKEITVTKQREEKYEVQERRVRYRSAKKLYPYNALKHVQRLELFLRADTELGGKPLSVSDTRKDSREGLEHDLNLEDIGLTPSRPNLINTSEWTRSLAAKLRNELSIAIGRQWASQHCQSPSSNDLASSGDQIHRCLRQKQASLPEFVDRWYKQNLGIPFAQASEVIALHRAGTPNSK